MKKIITSGGESSPLWETLETYARGEIQQFVQRLLEEEVDDLLGRKKSERRSEESAQGYRNGYARPRKLSLSSGTVTVERPEGARAVASAAGVTSATQVGDAVVVEVGGLELVSRLGKSRPEIRVLMMSGYTEQATVASFGLTALPFIEKPFASADLLAAIQRVLHGEEDPVATG